VYLLKSRFGIDPYLALPVVVPGMFVVGYALQRGIINRASHGRDENILLVTLACRSCSRTWRCCCSRATPARSRRPTP